MTGASWNGRRLAAVLFDLDGTLLDTVGDIALALNRATAPLGWPPLPVDAVRGMIGRGSPMLVRRAAAYLGRDADEALQASIVERFFDQYAALDERAERLARPFAGAEEALRALDARGLALAVVTNKQYRFADALVRGFGWNGWIDLVVGGDSCARRKPDPEPLLHACERLGVAPGAALMVGDSINDVQAARAAGLPVICVPYGYNEGRDPRSLPCDALVESLADLPALLTPGEAL
ncbi:MAG: phosphoglycolate phosphatase [Gammaproteobacteria bacterium]|nr:phosphoglycolate phosphatase [Gammaproteobacteria bacterium]